LVVTENALESLRDMDRYLGLLHAASGPGEFVNAVSEYLASWSKPKIENLRKVDGGWSPFANDVRPTPFRTVAAAIGIGDSVRRQLAALKEAGIALNPELLELDLFFFAATQVAEVQMAVKSLDYGTAARRGAYPQYAKTQASDRNF
jgi:hypothetical protein